LFVVAQRLELGTSGTIINLEAAVIKNEDG